MTKITKVTQNFGRKALNKGKSLSVLEKIVKKKLYF